MPLPEPAVVTVSEYMARANDAVTDRRALIVTWQAPVPVQAPLQPAKTEPPPGVGVRVTTVPET